MVNDPNQRRLTRRELAKICEVTPSAVSQAEARGALLADEGGMIDILADANVLWLMDHATPELAERLRRIRG